MDKPTHARPSPQAVGEEPIPSSGAPPATRAAPAAQARPDGRFVGHAMKALFETADVSIRRDDDTRVLSRAQEVLAELDRRQPPPPQPRAELPKAGGPISSSSTPPGPRVDAVLWVVLAGGLLAIAAWMLASAL